jgi:thioredoxin reductase (NADPH)
MGTLRFAHPTYYALGTCTSMSNLIRLLGHQWSPKTHEIKDYLARNRVAHEWLDVERSARARALLEETGRSTADLPVLVFADGTVLTDPSDEQLATEIGLSTETESPFYDLVIVGAGPAGMAAAVYAASEGLRTLVVERDAPGGQAGQSAAIENYLGFPDGISGSELARRALAQAEKFGVEILAAHEAASLQSGQGYHCLTLHDGQEIGCRAVLLAMGVGWRTLEAPGCPDLVGAGIYYGAASAEAPALQDREVFLLGGGNSAGQAAMHLAHYAKRVTMLALEESIAERMSTYLVERIEATPNIEVRPCCTITEAAGDRCLERVTIENVTTGERETVPADALYVFIGAQPETDWLDGVLARDAQGYLRTGDALRDVDAEAGGPTWPLEREPFLLETSAPGVFAAGDIRAESVKRVASAIGEGSMAVQFIHQYLAGR